jgi:hypothetical protein
MLHRVDHYSSLARAVARLGRDSYEARGAVYDRAQRALVKRLSAADPPHSQEDFDLQLLAFRYAVRRIEFGDDDVALDPANPAPPGGSTQPAQAPRPPVAATARSSPHEPDDDKPARPSVAGRVARRATFAAFVLAIGMAGYAVMTGKLALPQSTDAWPTDHAEDAMLAARGEAAAQQGVVYDDPPGTPDAVKVVGKAFWRTRTEPADASGERVVELDLQVPQRHLAMRMTMRRAPAGDAMSHLIEIKFLREDGQPDSDIAKIAQPYMTTVEQTRRVALAAQVVTVAPGVFLVGLLGAGTTRDQNERTLRELTWLDIPIVYRGDVPGMLAIEKGAEGERIINEALDAWRR